MAVSSRIITLITSVVLVLAAGSLWMGNRKPNSATSALPKSLTKASSKTHPNRTPGPRTVDEIRITAQAKPCARTVLTYLDLSRTPTQAELVAAGNLGEPLTATHAADPALFTDPAARSRQEEDNLQFGTAIQAWNQHRYSEAIALFEQHSNSSPDSPWVAESRLHLGCFCQYNGRSTEAADWFDGILSSVKPKSEMYHKAKLRRSILWLDQGNLEASLQGFTEMKRDDLDPAHQSYASYWIREIALLKKNEIALRDCGQKALARVAEISNEADEAKNLREMVAAGPHGFNAEELHQTALRHGLDSRPVRADTALADLPLPFVAHYQDHHFVTVEQVSDENVILYDSRLGQATMPRSSFMKQWSGFALIFSEPTATAAIHPAEDLKAIIGGCCGHPRSPSDLGDDGCEKNCGMPGWSVNPVNMNLRVGDTPMWWSPPVGPPVEMSLLFNSLDSLNNYEFFGEKWSFKYSSYLLITPGGQVQVKDGDGRLETFSQGSTAGIYPVTHTAPAGDFRQLTEIADHIYTLTHQDGTIYHYGVPAAMTGTSSVPLLLSISDRHDNTLTIAHNIHGAITEIGHSMLPALPAQGNTPATTRKWLFTYELFNNLSRVIRIDDPFGRSAGFGYDNNGHLRTQTDMGGLAYGYDYTTKLSQDAISINSAQTTDFPSATQELFITAINTPKGQTSILTEPSDGITNVPITLNQSSQGYSAAYPPIGAPQMWTNYRIRITNPEIKTEEYHFDGASATPYYRDPIQLNRPVGQSVAPTTGARVKYSIIIVGGTKGKINSTLMFASTGVLALNASYYSNTTFKKTSHQGPEGDWTNYEHYANGTPKLLALPKAGTSATDPFKIYYYYETNGTDLDKIQRHLDGTLRTLLDIDYWPGTRDVKQTTDGVGNVTSYTTPHPNGLPTSITDVTTGDVLTFTYDQGPDDADSYPTWRLLNLKRNNIIVTQTAYDSIGRPQMILDSSGDYSQPIFDNLNRLTRTDYSDNSFAEQIWECCHVSEARSGRIVSGQDRILARTKIVHDGRGLPIRSIDTAGKITKIGYDDAGRMTTLTDSKNQVTSWIHDGFGRLDKKVYQDTTYEQITWANMVQPFKIRNRRGQESGFSFDSNGNLRIVSGPGLNLNRTYDGWDRLKTIYDSSSGSGIHTYSYDDINRPTSLDGPWPNDTLSWQYLDTQRQVIRSLPGGLTDTTTGDTFGRLGSIENPLGTFYPSYDGDTTRVLAVTHSGGFDTAFTHYGPDFNHAIHTITSTLPGGSVIAKHTYGYDVHDRIKSWKREAPLADPSGATRSFAWESYYDFSSQLTSITEKSLAGTLQATWDYGHDPAGNISTVQTSTAPNTPALLTKRTHNSLNQIATTGGGGTTLIRGKLSEPGQVSVGITNSGDKPARMLEANRFETELTLQEGTNSISIAASDFSANRSDYQFTINVSAQSPQNFFHDNEGNLLTDGVRSYEWDTRSRLTEITWATGITTEFKYNALDQRSERIETNGSMITKSYYVYDGVHLIQRRTGGTSANTAIPDRYYYAQGEQRKNGSNWESYFYCRDHLGSIREVIKSDGTLQARYDYDPYGKRLTQYAAVGYVCDLGYTGHITTPSLEGSQTEIVLTHFRAYDPALSRWLSADPIGEEGGINLYGYVRNNPLNAIDPLGLARCKITTSSGITLMGENIAPAFIRSFLSLMPPGEMIREFTIDGHGYSQGINTDDKSKEGIDLDIGITASGVATAVPVWTDTGLKVSDQLVGHVDKDSKFRFDGCNTANNRPGLSGSANNLAKAFSEAFPDAEVTGLRGYGWFSNPVTGNANHVGGITRTYQKGLPK